MNNPEQHFQYRGDHDRSLKNDPEYLDQFLQATRIENEAEDIAGRLQSVYQLHGAEGELPDNLVDIIDRAHLDAEKDKRSGVVTAEGQWKSYNQRHWSLNDRAYGVLCDKPGSHMQLLEMDGFAKSISYEEALKEVKEKGRVPNYKDISAAIIYGSVMSKNPLIGFVVLPITLISATMEAFLPNSVRAKRLSERHNQEREIRFKKFSAEMEEIFDLYQE